MIIAILAFIVVAIVIVVGIREREPAAALFLFAAGAAVLLVLTMFIVTCFPTGRATFSTDKLSAFKDGSTQSGSAFLGSGYSSERPVYRFVIKDEASGRVNVYTVPQYAVTLYERPGTPTVTITTPEYFNEWVVPGRIVLTEKRYIIQIPEGSVVEEYQVDLEN